MEIWVESHLQGPTYTRVTNKARRRLERLTGRQEDGPRERGHEGSRDPVELGRRCEERERVVKD